MKHKPDKHCRNCGKTGLYWQNTPVGWRLFEVSNIPHHCRTDEEYYKEIEERAKKERERRAIKVRVTKDGWEPDL